ncbi:MAG: glutaredoxin family protein, partial [Myxococcota bacterium]|nr:glutaredoxin family protein [Myxococcota bacterium]
PALHPPTPLPPPATLADASRRVTIEMYSAAWCSACGRAKAWMTSQGIAYEEVDVDRRAGALAQLQMLNPRSSLPTFDVDGDVLVGFSETRLRTAIDDAARRSMRAHP